MRKIVFVSRLDADCSLGAMALCKIAPRLAEKYPDTIEGIIVRGECDKLIDYHAEQKID